jgi:hypothetical protein
MWISIFFSESGQSVVRNALEAASLAQAILHSHASRWRSRSRRETGHRGKAKGRLKAEKRAQGPGRGGKASRVKGHQPQAMRIPLSSQPSHAIPSQRHVAKVTTSPHTVTAQARHVEAAKRRQLSNSRESL